MKEEMEGVVFFFRQSQHFSLIGNTIKGLFSICNLNWPVHNYVSRQGKSINTRNESINIVI